MSKPERIKKKAGRRAYEPTAAERRMVMQLSGMKVTYEQLRTIIISPYSNKPIAKRHFARIFARELAEGRIRLKQLITNKFYEALEAGAPWAIRLGLRNNLGWSFEGSQPLEIADNVETIVQNIGVRFVLPPPKNEEPIDVTPSPYEGQPADLSRPALPPPPKRQRIVTGALWEEPSPGGWMK